MITKEKAYEVVINYLKIRKREYKSLPDKKKIGYKNNDEILYGKREGEKTDVFFMSYGVMWGNEERGAIVYVDANTGEVLYSINSHGWIEELEDN